MDWINITNAAINGIVLGLLLALPALAVTLVFGIARFPHAAVGDYMTFGAYTAILVQSFMSASLVAAALIASAATAFLSLFFYAWVFRSLSQRSPVSSLIASIGVAFAVRSVITFFAGQSQYVIEAPLVRAWNFSGVRILPTDLYVAATAVLALAAVFFMLHFTAFGRRMRAVADNPELAAASGIRVREVMITLSVIVGAFCGLGGMLMGFKAVVLPELGWELILPIFASVILGGIGSPVGAVCGMILFGISQEIASLYVGASYKLVLAFVVLLLVLLIRPQGMFGKIIAVR
ncbi:branched-chain amino acid ABC transporter permease [Pseudaminobacter sp. 19-2017]|uniref:Branched-chain amino acid ABC transporter permease n=1 Tax=Pseudaminobacter soli (ex Zhang et al. 2022) TaxID=2831468 RepID=A0A942E7E7_9HYPH|nr:branched-chain amino acid ABC transporter permease [Pseudaminobacter soli]MBS3649812.1 branched-chain amino acid ABC transporter permease [Pseudaminobacter soli]